ncbi:hypothetical protein MPLDJ20_320052 [Mesorhizobium plurifarium]|uniref:Uncharacterized protein n=1 Tax=Mesorhizobium plurifarium TaxID=69974 RepID=A0A090FB48_MESPL|nr:hypothetical protein MPLDJ20_320052 [Mesorhizobium plurifarium]
MPFDRDLADLHDLLQRADVLKGWGPNAVFRREDRTCINFAARLAIDTTAHVRPAGTQFDEATLELELELSNDDGLAGVQVCSAQVLIEGLNNAGEICRFALHFDRHEPSQVANELHAHYHWQVGGKQLENQEFGTVFQMAGPRFPWHPIDPVLLVDFVLGHFYGTKRADLMQLSSLIRYPRILYDSQTSFVTPFFADLHQSLSTDPFVATAYWPALCGAPT